MFRIAADLLRDTRIPFEALLPLIDNTAAKVHSMTPRDAQTGPAQRGDLAVIKHHLEVLRTMENGQATSNNLRGFSAEEMSEVYQLLAALIGKKHNHPIPPTGQQ